MGKGKIYCQNGGYCDGRGPHYSCLLIIKDMAG